mgnify:CR=1 FL=1
MKQIFIIAPHFPPSALPPSQRVRLLVKNCKKFGFYQHFFSVIPYYREESTDEWMCELLGKDFTKHNVTCLNQRVKRKN